MFDGNTSKHPDCKHLCSLKTELSNTIFSSSSMSSLGKSAVMKAFTVTDTSSGSWVSDRAVCTTWKQRNRTLQKKQPDAWKEIKIVYLYMLPGQWEVVCMGCSPAAHSPTAQSLCDGRGSATSSWRANSHCRPDDKITQNLQIINVLPSKKKCELKKDIWGETQKCINQSSRWSAPGHTVPSHRPHRTGGGLSFRSTSQPHDCHSMGFLSRNVRGCCCCQCRSWLVHYGWQAPHSLHGCETLARAAEA